MIIFEIIMAVLLGISLVIAFVFFVKEYTRLEKREKDRDALLIDIAVSLTEINELLKKYDDDNKGDLK